MHGSMHLLKLRLAFAGAIVTTTLNSPACDGLPGCITGPAGPGLGSCCSSMNSAVASQHAEKYRDRQRSSKLQRWRSSGAPCNAPIQSQRIAAKAG